VITITAPGVVDPTLADLAWVLVLQTGNVR